METSRDILDFDRESLQLELASSFGLESFRARQLVHWLYRRRVLDFDVMSDISREVRSKLSQHYRIFRPSVKDIQYSVDGSRKYLFELEDGAQVETVLIRQPTRYTLCVSSQHGCAIGCRFCRTGLMGLKRNLKTHEIIGQVLAVQDDIAKRKLDNSVGALPVQVDEEFQNIVFMGMGEPLHNYDNVIRAVKLLNDGIGLNFSSRKITVSTSGLVPAIKRFGESGAGANLAVSLNATTDEVRSKIIPINKKWPIAELLDTLRAYPLKSRKRITIEYVMLEGVNDSAEDLARLPKLLRGIPVKVNLIPYNKNTGLNFSPPLRKVVMNWQEALLAQGLNATVRWSKGEDISAACGQLATTEPTKRKLTNREAH